jgi:protein SCO1/2
MALIIAAVMAFKIFQPVRVLPRIHLAPGFIFTDQDNQRLTNEDVRGSFVLYNFTYTRCEPPCYNLDQSMKEIQERIGEANLGDIPISFVTISLDPEHDTPAVLKAYATRLGAESPQWRFVTTDDARMLKVVVGGGFEVYYQEQEDGSIYFDPHFVLVDDWGIIRGDYRYQTLMPDTERILRHIAVLADEYRNSHGAASAAYEAAHLFLCYAP